MAQMGCTTDLQGLSTARTSVYEETAHSAFGNWGRVVTNSCNPDLYFSLQSEWLRGTELPAGFKP